MKRYEVVYVAFHDQPTEDLDRQLERYRSIVTDYKGTVVRVDRWGKRRLAYPIQKRREGYYVLIDFAGDSAIIPEMERRLRIDDKILRFISVKKDDNVNPEELEREIAALQDAEAPAEVPASAEALEQPVEGVEQQDSETGDDSGEPPAKPENEPAETSTEEVADGKEG